MPDPIRPRRARRLLAAAAGVLLVPLLATGASAERGDVRRAVETLLTPGSTAITVTGHGFGHGHGLSQYGALGAAGQGLTWQQIVGFYYPGTTWGRIGGTVRIWITGDTGRDVQVVSEPAVKVTSLSRQRTWRLPDVGARKWRLVAAGSDTAVQWTRGGRWRTWRTVPGEAELSAADGVLTLVVPGDRRDYRGTLQSVAPGGGKRLTVNKLGMEAYLRGVVPQEVPALWEPDAVSAQSVAARTYAAFERRAAKGQRYDLCDTTQCQVYGGVEVEHPAATEAIRATRGQGVLYDGQPAFTQFSASNGGFSAAGSMPYLVAQPDPYDGLANPTYSTWTRTLDDTMVEKQWPAIGDLTRIEVTARDGNGDWGGRITDMAFVGTTGTARVDGDTVRSAFGLSSDWFTFAVEPRQKGRARQ